MPETAQIPTSTILNINGSSISVYTFYTAEGTVLSDIIQAFLAEVSSAIGVVTYIEGELVIIMMTNSSVNFSINTAGDLIIDAPNAEKYYISESGYIYFDDLL